MAAAAVWIAVAVQSVARGSTLFCATSPHCWSPELDFRLVSLTCVWCGCCACPWLFRDCGVCVRDPGVGVLAGFSFVTPRMVERATLYGQTLFFDPTTSTNKARPPFFLSTVMHACPHSHVCTRAEPRSGRATSHGMRLVVFSSARYRPCPHSHDSTAGSSKTYGWVRPWTRRVCCSTGTA